MISRVVIVQSVVCFYHELVILFSGCFWSSLSVASIKSNKVSGHFLFTGYMHNALYDSSTKYDFPSLDVFFAIW